MKRPVIVYFRQDLRIGDNPALTEACKSGSPIIPLYIYDTEYPKGWSPGGAQKWWLHHSLNSLSKELPLILRKGNPVSILKDLVEESNAEAIYYNRCYEPWARRRDNDIGSQLSELPIHTFNGSLLIEPWEIMNKSGSYYKVFSQFWRNAKTIITPPQPLGKPKIDVYNKKIKSDKLSDWNLLPTHPDWSGGINDYWKVSEDEAQKRLNGFIKDGLEDYKKTRDIPGIDNTSHLSPYLHMGQISPRQVWHTCQASETYINEIGWREFSYYLLYHFPELPITPFVRKFSKFKWDKDESALKAWQKGLTGYPIVDAGMRQLWHIGWMHNRVRMIVASFLTKDLFIHWRHGQDWFWDTLVDADLASNAASWQWVAGCGADAAPYFRIFNPVTQGEKFDPEGEYIRSWIPELKELPNKFIHRPWEAPEMTLRMAGINLGKDYPKPLVDHKEARDEALKRFAAVKNT